MKKNMLFCMVSLMVSCFLYGADQASSAVGQVPVGELVKKTNQKKSSKDILWDSMRVFFRGVDEYPLLNSIFNVTEFETRESFFIRVLGPFYKNYPQLAVKELIIALSEKISEDNKDAMTELILHEEGFSFESFFRGVAFPVNLDQKDSKDAPKKFYLENYLRAKKEEEEEKKMMLKPRSRVRNRCGAAKKDAAKEVKKGKECLDVGSQVGKRSDQEQPLQPVKRSCVRGKEHISIDDKIITPLRLYRDLTNSFFKKVTSEQHFFLTAYNEIKQKKMTFHFYLYVFFPFYKIKSRPCYDYINFLNGKVQEDNRFLINICNQKKEIDITYFLSERSSHRKAKRRENSVHKYETLAKYIRQKLEEQSLDEVPQDESSDAEDVSDDQLGSDAAKKDGAKEIEQDKKCLDIDSQVSKRCDQEEHPLRSVKRSCVRGGKDRMLSRVLDKIRSFSDSEECVLEPDEIRSFFDDERDSKGYLLEPEEMPGDFLATL